MTRMIQRNRLRAMARLRSALVVTTAALISACGATGGSSEPGKAERITIPETIVRDLATDADVVLTDAIATDGPTMLWFWAPH
jgi:hypothetical protein